MQLTGTSRMTKPDIAIITAIYDDYDTLKPIMPQVGAEVEWVFVTDQQFPVETPRDDPRWQYSVTYEPHPGMHPNRAAKHPKMAPHRYTIADRSIWIDGSFRVKSPHFARDMMDVLEKNDIAQFEHPWRNCIYDEAEETLKLDRYADVHKLIPSQMKKYRTLYMHPKNWGLWATGVIARNHNKSTRDFGAEWLADNLYNSYQDQLSEAVHLRARNLRPYSLLGTHFANPWLSYEGSGRH